MSYNYNPKVEHPRDVLIQMVSEEYKPPFYFGGSQVPVSINHLSMGRGLKSHYKSSVVEQKQNPACGSGFGMGLKTTSSKHSNIRLPKTFFNK